MTLASADEQHDHRSEKALPAEDVPTALLQPTRRHQSSQKAQAHSEKARSDEAQRVPRSGARQSGVRLVEAVGLLRDHCRREHDAQHEPCTEAAARPPARYRD
jgi:hypothetical protein